MNKFIQPYQYNFIKDQADQLLKAHRSVNDFTTIDTIKMLAIEKIENQFWTLEPAEKELLQKILTIKSAQKDADDYLASLQAYVIPFVAPTDAGLKKLFPKTKKLKIPEWEAEKLTDYTFYGWNDAGKQRKFIVLYQDGKLTGIQGTLSPNTHKGFCAICHASSQVSLFMSTGKHSKDGTFKSKGNYICYDSEKCNQQIMQLDELEKFVQVVSHK